MPASSAACVVPATQGVQQHAVPASEEVSEKIEDGAAKFGERAPRAAKQLGEAAIGGAKDVSARASPAAHQVRATPDDTYYHSRNMRYTHTERESDIYIYISSTSHQVCMVVYHARSDAHVESTVQTVAPCISH